MTWILEWLAFSLSVFIVARLLPSVHIRNFGTAVGVALVYGVLKIVLYWLLVLLALPLVILTLGLFLLVLNAVLLWLTDKLIAGFEIDGLLNTLFASVLISMIDVVLCWLIPGI